MTTTNNLEELRDDLVAALAVFDALGKLTDIVRHSIDCWFIDTAAEEILPLAQMPLEPEEHHDLLSLVLTEMIAAVQTKVDSGMDVTEAFAELAPTLDPLWREFRALHAGVINEEWEDSRPTDDEELEEVIDHLEHFTGMDRSDLRARAATDRRIHGTITHFGLTLEDLDN